MKAKILSLLLVVALVVTVSVFTVQADDTYVPAKTAEELQQLHPTCPHCRKSVTWTQFGGRSSVALSTFSGGHYYFDKLYDTTGEAAYSMWFKSGTKTCIYFLDVEGGSGFVNASSSSSGYAFQAEKGSEVALMGKGRVAGHGTNAVAGRLGGAFCLDSGTSASDPGAKLTVYHEVTVEREAKASSYVSYGGAVYLGEYASLILEGGNVVGGNAYMGGAIHCSEGSAFTMNAGTVTGGTALGYSTDSTTINGYGGAISLDKCTATVNGGTISGGSAVEKGGAVYVNGSSSVFKMNGGEISGGTQTGARTGTNYYGGGAVYLNNSATMNMTAGTVQGSKVNQDGGSVYLYDGILNMTGGTIKSAANGGTRGGAIYMNGSNAKLTIGKTGNEKQTAKIEGVGKGFTNGGLICNAAGTVDIYDGAWLTGGLSSANNKTNMGGGALYVTGTANIHGGLIDSNSSYSYGGNIHVLTAGKLNISGGTISGGKAEMGGNIFNTGTTKITGGIISGGTATDDVDATSLTDNFGGNICNFTNTVTISGGEITGGTAENGGTIYAAAEVTVSGGTITEGTATNGGTIYAAAKVTVSNGTITGGTATTGGNIYATAELAISGGTITEGTAENGGNIYTTAAINMTGGTISYGESTKTIPNANYASYGGGNVFLTGAAAIFTMNGANALVTEGDAALNGGNIFLMNSAKFQLVTGTVSNGAAAYTGSCGLQGGGNIHATDGATTVDIDGGTVTGGTAKRGGNIALVNDAGMDVSGDAKISVTTPMANTAWLGANIFVRGTSSAAGDVILGGSCTISGAETYADTDSDYGGNIYLHGYSNLTLKENAVITGGKAKNGGNIYMSNATSKVMMQGGEISSGSAKGSSGTNIFMSLGTLQLSGGEICDGMNSGNSVYVNNNTNNQLTLSGTIKVDQLFIRGTGSAQANIQLEDSFTGRVQFRFANETEEEKAFYNSIGYGTVITGYTNVTVAETYDNTGSILVGAKVNNNPTYLDAYYATATKNLLIANYSKTDASGKTTYIEDLTEVGEGECLTLIRDMELTLTTDMIVDTNGMDATITTEGGAEVSLIDQTNTKDSTGFGKITISKDALASYKTTFDDKRYITVSNGDGTYSAHLLEARVKSVVLRTETAGIYYNVELLCDRALEDLVQSYGVALSVQSMPDATFADLGTSRTDMRYTAIAKCSCAGVCQHPDVHFKTFESGSYTSCALNNILAANIPEGGISNDIRGNMPVYANGYVTICVDDGKELMLMTDEVNKNLKKGAAGWDASVAIAYSICDVMKLVDGKFSTLSPENQGYIVDFYTTWQADIQTWDLPNIKKAYQDSLA